MLISPSSFRFLQVFAFSPRLEWLSGEGNHPLGKEITAYPEWIWQSLTPYAPIESEYRPQHMAPGDFAEEQRLMETQQAAAFYSVWLQQMAETDNPLREKMALFWHHHIPCTYGVARLFVQARQLLEIYRKHGLGNLRDLMREAFRAAVLMRFLNISSDKSNPNENFARELMELFTLGEGNYTLKDVKEVARAFTGRFFDKKNYPYAYSFVPSAHDDGIKTILGKTGRFDGDDVIDILLERPQTAQLIARSVLRFLFCDNPPDEMVRSCGEAYFKSGFEMRVLLESLMTQKAFYDPVFIQSKVKTPVELLVGFQRQTGLRTRGVKTTNSFLRYCGQSLFSPPSVAGWPGGADWLRGERLFHRLFLPGTLLEISNRRSARDSVGYKVSSRIFSASKRKFRYIADAQWDAGRFYDALKEQDLHVSEWMLGQKRENEDLEYLLQAPEYQYC